MINRLWEFLPHIHNMRGKLFYVPPARKIRCEYSWTFYTANSMNIHDFSKGNIPKNRGVKLVMNFITAYNTTNTIY